MTAAIAPPDANLLIDVVRAVLDRHSGKPWTVTPTGSWCAVTSPSTTRRPYGWKLHVTATPLAASPVLARCAEVLVSHGCSFKFATDLPRVAELVGERYDRGSGGKFLTAYPDSDDHLRVVAEELHVVTLGLPGPAILSDRQLRPGSSVYYRYGGFWVEPVLTDDGVYETRMTGPDGTVTTDERRAWFSPPSWASVPFPDSVVPVATEPADVLIGGRFRVHTAIRHANRGGVFRAVDESGGADVLLKQARAHVGATLAGTDVRDRLRAEAGVLDELGSLGLTPARIALFEEEGDLFLAEELVPGRTLHAWAADRAGTGGPPLSEAVAMAARLSALLRAVHEWGLVVVDLKPSNVMVTPFEELRLIDVELVTRLGEPGFRAATAGFAAPELLAGIDPAPAGDCFSFGVTVFCVLTGLAPDLVPAYAEIATAHPTLAAFAAAIEGLTRSNVDRRWTLDRFDKFLSTMDGTPSVAPPPSHSPADGLDRLIAAQVSSLRDNWSTPVSSRRDGCAAWYGVAGPLAVLARAVRTGAAQAHDTVAEAAAWVDERAYTAPRFLPGLYVGRAGTAWALFDAAEVLADDALAVRAKDLSARLPTTWPIPGVSHGLAGAGLTHLRLWCATGDTESLHRAVRCADAVLGAARHSGDQHTWPVPADADSAFAGTSQLGYAHGVAGVGAFLLAVGQATGGLRFTRAAYQAGITLAGTANRGGDRDRDGDRMSWPVEAGGGKSAGAAWCTGTAGIGHFLIRLWAATGEERFASLAEQAATLVDADPWRPPIGACCGLAGGAHLLLDLAELTGDQRYRTRAEDLVPILSRRSTAEPPPGPNYASGTAGVLDFLLRLRYGGGPPWTPALDTAVHGGEQTGNQGEETA
jgi:hypothetical protein